MHGKIIMYIDAIQVVAARYETPNGRHSIISLFKALYGTKEYTVTIIPDERTTNEVLAQGEAKGYADAYCRAFNIRRDDHYPNHPMVQ